MDKIFFFFSVTVDLFQASIKESVFMFREYIKKSKKMSYSRFLPKLSYATVIEAKTPAGN
jgi:hypothetical protein